MDKKRLKSVSQESTTKVSKSELADLYGQIEAMHTFQCVAEYNMDGLILYANENHLNLMGYTLSELLGQDIGMLLDLKSRHSANNVIFWEGLNNGESISGTFKRIGKGAKTVWIRATYFPMLGTNSKPFKVLEYAVDITWQVQLEQALSGMVEEVQEVVQAVKNKDLRSRISLEGKTGEIAKLSDGVNSLVDNMEGVITLIHKTGNSILAAAKHFNAASKILSQRWENQSSPPIEIRSLNSAIE